MRYMTIFLVSIPYRYSMNICPAVKSLTFLQVSIPYRYSMNIANMEDHIDTGACFNPL